MTARCARDPRDRPRRAAPERARGRIAELVEHEVKWAIPTVAFSGDHVWADDDDPTSLAAGRELCWYSRPEQLRSIEALAEHRFTWVLPGHGRRFRAADHAVMRAALLALARQ